VIHRGHLFLALYVVLWASGMVTLVILWRDMVWFWRIVASIVLGVTSPAVPNLWDAVARRKDQ
jgi:hypothetical protein